MATRFYGWLIDTILLRKLECITQISVKLYESVVTLDVELVLGLELLKRNVHGSNGMQT